MFEEDVLSTAIDLDGTKVFGEKSVFIRGCCFWKRFENRTEIRLTSELFRRSRGNGRGRRNRSALRAHTVSK
jgi:hypothetical protein